MLRELLVMNMDLRIQLSLFKYFGSNFHCWIHLQMEKKPLGIVAQIFLILQSIPKVCHSVLAKWLHVARDTS